MLDASLANQATVSADQRHRTCSHIIRRAGALSPSLL